MPEQTLAAEPGVLLATGFTVSLVLAAALEHLPLGPAAATACFAAVLAALALGGPRRAALGNAGIAWSVLTGFVVHRLGTLTLAPADLVRGATLVVVGLGAAQLTRAR